MSAEHNLRRAYHVRRTDGLRARDCLACTRIGHDHKRVQQLLAPADCTFCAAWNDFGLERGVFVRDDHLSRVFCALYVYIGRHTSSLCPVLMAVMGGEDLFACPKNVLGIDTSRESI